MGTNSEAGTRVGNLIFGSKGWMNMHDEDTGNPEVHCSDIKEGHLSTSLCHLGNIACRLKRTLHFNPSAEQFVNDTEADSYLTKMYRAPYLLPNTV